MTLYDKIREAKTVEEVFDVLEISHVSPEAGYVEKVWEAFKGIPEQ